MPLPAKLRADRHLRNQSWPFLLGAVRHKRPFEQSRWNGRLAFESCHWHGVAGPGGHNVLMWENGRFGPREHSRFRCAIGPANRLQTAPAWWPCALQVPNQWRPAPIRPPLAGDET